MMIQGYDTCPNSGRSIRNSSLTFFFPSLTYSSLFYSTALFLGLFQLGGPRIVFVFNSLDRLVSVIFHNASFFEVFCLLDGDSDELAGSFSLLASREGKKKKTNPSLRTSRLKLDDLPRAFPPRLAVMFDRVQNVPSVQTLEEDVSCVVALFSRGAVWRDASAVGGGFL
jgi:hypothetical protein